MRQRAKWLVTLAAPFAALATLEVALRLAGFQQPVDPVPILVLNGLQPEDLRASGSPYQYDPAALWVPRPGAPVEPGRSERINAAGFRGPEPSLGLDPGTLRVALVGESSILGVGVPWEQTCAPRLTELLAQRQVRAEVLNAGVLGHTVVQGVGRYRSAVRPLRPSVVCAAFGAFNESEPCPGLADLERLTVARERGDAPNAWDRLGRHLRSLQLVGWARTRREDAELRSLLERREQERAAGLDAIGRTDWPGCRRVPLERFEEALLELASDVKADGGRLILVSLPRLPSKEQRAPVLARYSECLASTGQRLGVAVVDLRAQVQQAVEAGADPASFFAVEDEWHLGPKGQELLASALAEAIAPVR